MKLNPPVITTRSSLESLLTAFAHVLPPGNLVHVGAGEGSGPVHVWHSWGVPNVLLVDADPARLSWSSQLREAGASVFVSGDTVANDSQERKFYRCSLATENGLVDPKELRSLWSNLSEISSETRAVVTLDHVIDHNFGDHNLDTTWLIIDCFNGLSIVAGASIFLNKTALVCVRVLVDETASGSLKESSLAPISNQLTKQGFSCSAVVTGLHPKIAYAVFCRDVVSTLTSESIKAKESIAAIEQQFKLARTAVQEKTEALDTAQAGWASTQNELAKLKETVKATLESKESELLKAKADLSQSQQLHQSSASVSQLEKKIESLFSDQRLYIQQTTNALGQHVTRTTQQQRDQAALLQYMQSGQWPAEAKISPNYAKTLVEMRDARQYDVIVVCGSAVTAEFLAHLVMSPRTDSRRLTNESDLSSNVSDVTAKASYKDLPQSIVVLEHLKDQCETLKQKLQTRGYEQAVDVVHAPWIETVLLGETSLFYACDRALQRLNHWLKEDARVLVVLGDALSTAGHTRLASLPAFLQQLPTQSLDFVLENQDIKVESVLNDRWESLLNDRQLTFETLTVPNAFALRING